MKLAFISDIHYYSRSLGDTGEAYSRRERSDQKCLKESGAILSALAQRLASEDIGAVVIAGDITNDGEMPCHTEAISILDGLNATKPVFAITSTHDWCSDRRAKSYAGDGASPFTDTVSREALPEFYTHFGEKHEHSRFVTSAGQVSRSFILNGEILLLAINDDCDGAGGASGYSDEHLSWVFAQLLYARQNGLSPVAFEHHLLLDSVSGIVNRGQKIADAQKVAAALADGGLRLIFTGHSHFQRISSFVSPAGNKITQINLGAAGGYPGLITYAETEDGRAKITEEPYTFIYDGRELGTEYLRGHTLGLLGEILKSARDDYSAFLKILRDNGIPDKWAKIAKPVLKPLFSRALGASGSDAAKLFNRFFRGAIDKQTAAGVKDVTLSDVISAVFLSLFWHGEAENQSPAVRALVTQAANALPRAAKLVPGKKKKEKVRTFLNEISALAQNLEYPEHLPDAISLTD